MRSLNWTVPCATRDFSAARASAVPNESRCFAMISSADSFGALSKAAPEIASASKLTRDKPRRRHFERCIDRAPDSIRLLQLFEKRVVCGFHLRRLGRARSVAHHGLDESVHGRIDLRPGVGSALP